MNRTKLCILGLALLVGVGLFVSHQFGAGTDDPDWVAAQRAPDGDFSRDDLVALPSQLGHGHGIARTNFIPEDIEPREDREPRDLDFEQRRLKKRMEREGFRRMMNSAVMPLRDAGDAGGRKGR